MAIRVDYTPYAAVGRLSLMAGDAVRRIRDQQYRRQAELIEMQDALRKSSMVLSAQLAGEAREQASVLDLQKATQAAELQFQYQTRLAQAKDDIDLQAEMGEYMYKQQKYNLQLRQIDEADYLSDDEKAEFKQMALAQMGDLKASDIRTAGSAYEKLIKQQGYYEQAQNKIAAGAPVAAVQSEYAGVLTSQMLKGLDPVKPLMEQAQKIDMDIASYRNRVPALKSMMEVDGKIYKRTKTGLRGRKAKKRDIDAYRKADAIVKGMEMYKQSLLEQARRYQTGQTQISPMQPTDVPATIEAQAEELRSLATTPSQIIQINAAVENFRRKGLPLPFQQIRDRLIWENEMRTGEAARAAPPAPGTWQAPEKEAYGREKTVFERLREYPTFPLMR